MAAHANIKSAPPIQLFDRSAIEREVERLIALLDALDGDPDLEPDDEDDEHDGREPDERFCDGVIAPRPIYGIDQTELPINLKIAEAELAGMLKAFA